MASATAIVSKPGSCYGVPDGAVGPNETENYHRGSVRKVSAIGSHSTPGGPREGL